MPDSKDQGAVPQGLIEQARAKDVDPGHLQMLGKQAAALHEKEGSSLSDSVVRVIGEEELGPEHARRVCEFANQAAFQNEWEKGGSVRNIEFDGGPADPAVVLRDMHDGARQPAERVTSDYDTPPPIKLAADRRVEEEIFAGHTDSNPHPTEVAPGMPDMVRLRDTIVGAQDHIFSKIAGLEVTKEAVGLEMADLVTDEVLRGTSLYKVANAWTHFTDDRPSFQEALDTAVARMTERGLNEELLVEKTAAVDTGKIPNPAHPVISRFIEFTKLATQIRTLRGAVNVLEEHLAPVNEFIKTGSITKEALGAVGRMALGGGLVGGGIGALAADPGERGRGFLRGATIGAMGAGGLAAGAKRGITQVGKQAISKGVTPQMARLSRAGDPWARQAIRSQMGTAGLQKARSTLSANVLGGAGLGLAGGGLASHALFKKPQQGYAG